MDLWDAHKTVELLPTYQLPRECDRCLKVRSDDPDDHRSESENVSYSSSDPWYRGQLSEIDICSECYPNFYVDLIRTVENGTYRFCDVCIQDIGDKQYYTNESGDYDVCESCYLAKRPFGYNVNQSGILTERDTYIPAKHMSYDSIPLEMQSEITVDRNRLFIELLDSIVRMPDNCSNILEWTLITDLTPCKYHHADCGFAINVIDPRNPVASVVSDDHGRVAMNIVYNTYADYLHEKDQYESLSFAEYIRTKRNMTFYYG